MVWAVFFHIPSQVQAWKMLLRPSWKTLATLASVTGLPSDPFWQPSPAICLMPILPV